MHRKCLQLSVFILKSSTKLQKLHKVEVPTLSIIKAACRHHVFKQHINASPQFVLLRQVVGILLSRGGGGLCHVCQLGLKKH